MTQDEFDDFLLDFRAGFRGVDSWLGKFSREECERTLQWWFRVLKPISLADAQQAAYDLFSQESKLPPFSKIPAAIKSIATRSRYQRKREDKSTYIDGEPVYRCPKCQDDGRVIRRIQVPDDHPFPNFPYRAAFACDCEAGERWAKPWTCPRYHEVPADQRPTPMARVRSE